jgi:hypothetical protein
VTSPYCPTCHRRLHPKRGPRKPNLCVVCAGPVEYQGAGRPRIVCVECRPVLRKLASSKRDAH